MHDAVGMVRRVANGVHPVREVAARRQIDDDDVRRHREQPVGEAVAVARRPGDVELVGRTLHRHENLTRIRRQRHE